MFDTKNGTTVVIYGPAGCGKTHHAAALAKRYNCGKVVEGWGFDMPLQDNALHLTNMMPPIGWDKAHFMSFDAAMAYIRPHELIGRDRRNPRSQNPGYGEAV